MEISPLAAPQGVYGTVQLSGGSRYIIYNVSCGALRVAAQAGFSKYHFSRLFKQYTDSTFYKYLNQKRIEYAKTLLQDPGMTVTEVAFKSGFSSLSAFLRMFKLMNNCTPTEFREMYDSTKLGAWESVKN